MSPEYLQYGALMVPPAAFRSLNTTLYGFMAEADGEKLDALCQKVFTQTSRGEIDILAIGDKVMLTWGKIEAVSSLTPPYDAMGAVAEPQVCVWVPVAFVDRKDDDRIVATRFAMFVPYLWVDNAMSLATGRELFGYPKSWAEIGFPQEGASPRRWSLRAFGLDYAGGALAQPHDLLELVEGDALEGDGEDPWYDGPLEVARDVADRLFDRDDEERIVPGLRLAADLAGDLIDRSFRHLFLKQVRDIADGTEAALQQITEAHYKVRGMRARPRLREYSLTVHPLDSQPLITELGLRSQTLNLAYEIEEMDFDVGDGRVLWP